ncbi:MAG: hypothetical protein ACI4OT_05835 [Bacilli bacterium]
MIFLVFDKNVLNSDFREYIELGLKKEDLTGKLSDADMEILKN